MLYRGTTPTITFNITSDIDYAEIAEIWITFKSTSVERNYVYTDGEVIVDEENHQFSIEMTQNDTLQFPKGMMEVQIRLLMSNGKSYASKIMTIQIKNILKGGIIE